MISEVTGRIVSSQKTIILHKADYWLIFTFNKWSYNVKE